MKLRPDFSGETDHYYATNCGFDFLVLEKAGESICVTGNWDVGKNINDKGTIPVGCVPPACQLYPVVFHVWEMGGYPTFWTYPPSVPCLGGGWVPPDICTPLGIPFGHTHPETYPPPWDIPSSGHTNPLDIPTPPGHTHSPWTYPHP